MKKAMLADRQGFTILELMAAVTVMIIGVLGAYSIVQNMFALTFDSSIRLTAAYLAQEGMENVRSTRDDNWLNDKPWHQGITLNQPQVETNVIPNYNRETTVTMDGENKVMNVEVKVIFNGKGGTKELIVEEKLYDWY